MSTPPGDQRQGPSAPPAPRGSRPRRPRFTVNRNWTLFFLALLALNIYLGSRAMKEPARPRVPYSPFFLQQVRDGNVKDITSKGTAIQGTFKQKEQYKDSKPSDRFKTEIPAFADNDALSKLLQSKGVIVNAQPLETGSPWWQSLLLFFGPTILFVGLLFFLMRRAGNVQNILGSFGRSRASRYQPSTDRVTFKDVAGIDEAKDELSEVVDFLRRPEKYRKLGGKFRAASCWPARRAPGRRCSHVRSPGRRTLRSSRLRRPSSSRRSSASGPLVSATCSRRPRRRRLRSSSSTSSTRSAAQGRPASPASAEAMTSASRR